MKDSPARTERLAVLLLCGLFLFFATGVSLVGSSVYRRTVQRAEQTASQRTASAYLFQQARQCRQAGGRLYLDAVEGQSALALEVDGYVTYLYCYDGSLRELFTDVGNALPASGGTALYPLSRLTLEPVAPGLVQAQLEGEELSCRVLLPCENGEVVS